MPSSAYTPPQGNPAAEERIAAALEFIAGKMVSIETQLEAISRDHLKIATVLQTKLR